MEAITPRTSNLSKCNVLAAVCTLMTGFPRCTVSPGLRNLVVAPLGLKALALKFAAVLRVHSVSTGCQHVFVTPSRTSDV
jgi:hypothetical protein